MNSSAGCARSKPNQSGGIEMNARKMFTRAVAGRFLDRINRINRILGNGSNILNLVNPVNPV